MKTRFRLIRRGIRGGLFYCVDTHTRKRVSLRTHDEDSAKQIVLAKNQAERQPVLNLQIAKAYIAGTDSGIATRTWQQAMDALIATKQDANQRRWQSAAKDKAIKPLLSCVIIETRGETILDALRNGTVSTNVFLRRLHNFCVDMNWLPWPLVPKRQWPELRFKEKRAITLEEHQRIVAAEVNPERKALDAQAAQRKRREEERAAEVQRREIAQREAREAAINDFWQAGGPVTALARCSQQRQQRSVPFPQPENGSDRSG